MSEYLLFTSESVAAGHPDKIADQIADAILDGILQDDPDAHVAVEVLVKTGLVIIAGEITTTTYLDIDETVRKVIIEIGYNRGDLGFDGECVAVLNAIGRQSSQIANAVKAQSKKKQGAGDQGVMFGYATDETSEFMPAPILYAHKLMERHAQLRKSGEIDWLRPDAKSQITFAYDSNGAIVKVDNIVMSVQHDPEVDKEKIRSVVLNQIINPIIPEKWLDASTKYHINSAGLFVIGGPEGDCGLTGRKIIVDTYGGMARHGGGSFSGKDPSKVDRSAAYMCRYIAKNIVAAQLAKKCEVQLSYAIGESEPTSVSLNTFRTGTLSDSELTQLVKKCFDLSAGGIIKTLELKRPIYQKTACYGHFGRPDKDFTWENTNKVVALREGVSS